MTPAQKAAFINAQAVRMLCEIKLMEAANKERENQGYSQAYGDDAFAGCLSDYNMLQEDQIRLFFRD